MTMERFPTRRAVRLAERTAIRSEKPLYNSHHASREEDVPASSPEPRMSATKFRVQVLKMFVSMTYTERDVVEMLGGYGKGLLDSHIRSGDIRFFFGAGGFSKKLQRHKPKKMFSAWEVLHLIEKLERDNVYE
jgi:hypothetical protein